MNTIFDCSGDEIINTAKGGWYTHQKGVRCLIPAGIGCVKLFAENENSAKGID